MQDNMYIWSEETKNQFLAATTERFEKTNTVSKVFPTWQIPNDMLTVPTSLVEPLEDGNLLVDTAATTPQTRLWTSIEIPEEQIEQADEVAIPIAAS